MERFSQEVKGEYDKAKHDDKLKARGSGRRAKEKRPQIDNAELLRQQEALFAMARSDPMAHANAAIDQSEPHPG